MPWICLANHNSYDQKNRKAALQGCYGQQWQSFRSRPFSLHVKLSRRVSQSSLTASKTRRKAHVSCRTVTKEAICCQCQVSAKMPLRTRSGSLSLMGDFAHRQERFIDAAEERVLGAEQAE